MVTDALISECGTYRYWLSRVWDAARPVGVWVMLNPSTADASVDDPTVRRVVGFSSAWGWGGVRVYNLFALRSPTPDLLLEHADPVGPDNDRHIRSIPRGVPVVAAWGSRGDLHDRAAGVCTALLPAGVELQCLGVNKDGTPKHPLYVRGGTALLPFRPSAAFGAQARFARKPAPAP